MDAKMNDELSECRALHVCSVFVVLKTRCQSAGRRAQRISDILLMVTRALEGSKIQSAEVSRGLSSTTRYSRCTVQSTSEMKMQLLNSQFLTLLTNKRRLEKRERARLFCK